MFKVLVIAYYFPPMGLSGVQRVLKFTKYMGHYGWKPTIITTDKTAYYAHDKSLMEEAVNADINIVRTGGKDPNSILSKHGTMKMPRECIRKTLGKISKTIFIPDNKKYWAKKAYKKAKEILSQEEYDIIFVSIPPFSQFQIAAKLKKKFEIPLIVDYRDAWLDNQFAFYITPYHRWRHKRMEYSALRYADKIIAVNRKIKEKLLKSYEFLSFKDIEIIPHGYDPEDFENIQPKDFKERKLKILYSGIFYESVTPKYFLKAYKQLSEERPDISENIELHFIGHLRTENKKLVKRLNLSESVIDHGYLDHKDAIKYLISMDVLWLMLGNSKNMEMVSAGKLFEYFGTRKPIIACLPEGASKTAAENYGASFITKPNDIKAITETLIDVYNKFKNKSLPIPNEQFILDHDRKQLTYKLIKNFQFHLKEIS
ncbi:MAG: glycosyltransferase [Bacteroidota bacterium]